ncbi:MAG TPA: hypothetical protein VNM90_04910, partial [Haliangium sp.]|nr:hypothetical protein [Haliangium sp.]
PHLDDWASPFCDEHQESDTRWSHAKLYELCEGTRRRLLITSANLSLAAWGEPRPGGRLEIDNFELGVVVPIREGFSNRLGHGPYVPATREPDYKRPRELAIAWLAAEWDGRTLRIECRPGVGVVLAPRIEVTVAPSAKTRSVAVTWSRTAVAHARVPWPLEWGTPVLVSVAPKQGDARETAVHDVRKTDDGSIVCGEFDEARLRDMLDALIEEKYGYRPPVEGESDTETNGGSRKGDSHTRGADYAVPAYVDARRRFSFIDNWWHELCAVDERVRPFVLADGKRILERWRAAARSVGDRGLRLAAQLAAEELELRIRRLA